MDGRMAQRFWPCMPKDEGEGTVFLASDVAAGPHHVQMEPPMRHTEKRTCLQ